ncbi:MAG: hypothetical protein JSV15_00410 [Candidatus Bathyarchaeota archaeon]|nr:MAG: hypothetical protein JSV15_00410 [Candidatus Bathyarchaeota archaeon]
MQKKLAEVIILLIVAISTVVAPAAMHNLPANSTSTVMPDADDIFAGSFSPSEAAPAPNEAFDVSFSIRPTSEAPNTIIRLITPADLVRLVEGESVWRGNVEKGERVNLEFSMVADEGIDANVRVNVEACPEDATFTSSYYLHVTTLSEEVSPASPGEIIASARPASSSISTEELAPQASAEELVPMSPGSITIRGTMWYVNEDGGYSPMRQVKVFLMDEDVDWDEEVDWQWTNYNGEYSFTVNNDDPNGRDPYVEVHSNGGAANCKTGDDDWYVVVLPKCGDNVPDGFYYDYGILVPGSYNEAWQAIDACLSERDWIAGRVGWQRPSKVKILWPHGDWPSHLEGTIKLPHKITPHDPWNHVTVYHEYGHAVMYALYGHMPSGSGPDPHFIMSESSGGFAMKEGWAEFMQAAVDNDPNNLADAGQNVETNDWYNHVDSGDMDGAIVEGSVASILWDIFDPIDWAGDNDYLGMGFDEIFTVMRYDQPDNMDEFWSKWVARWPGFLIAGPLCTIYWHYGIDKDTFEPFGGLVVVNGGDAYTQSKHVTLSLFCSDWGIGVTHMRFSYRYPSPDWTMWHEYSTSGSYYLYGDDGPKSVYVQFRDGKGQTSPVYSDDIVLDTVPPYGAIVIEGLFVQYTTTMSVQLYLVYGDATSGVDSVRYRNSDGAWRSWTIPSGMKTWFLSPGDGVKRVYYQIRDRADWVSEYHDEIILDSTAPVTTLSHTPSSSTVTLSAIDATSGIQAIYHRVDGGVWSVYTGPISLIGTGTHTIDYYSEDNAGNAEDIGSSTFHYLTVDTHPNGLDAPTGEGWYEEEETASMSVSPVPGFIFKYWFLDGALQTPYSFDLSTEIVGMDGPHTATARFAVIATVDVIPNTLNLKSKAAYVKAFIEFPEGYDVSEIDVSTILLNGTIPVDSEAPVELGDYDGDGIPDLMVKFSGAEVFDYIKNNIDLTELAGEKSMDVNLTVTGELSNTIMFQGIDTVKVKMPMPKGKAS